MSDNQANHKEISPRDLEAKTSFPKSKIKILLLENIHPVAVKILTDHEFQVRMRRLVFSFKNNYCEIFFNLR